MGCFEFFVVIDPIFVSNYFNCYECFSVFCGIFLCICVIYRSISSNVGGPTFRHDNPVKWYSTSIREILTAVSISELAFSCHFNILPMHDELRSQTRSNKRAILFICMGIAFIINFAVSFFGYMQVWFSVLTGNHRLFLGLRV